MNIQYKQCTCCRRNLPTNRFSKDTRHQDGLQSQCKDCASERTRVWSLTHKSQKRASDKAYREHNVEKVATKKRQEQVERPHLQATRNKRWKSNHKEQVNASTRRRRSLKKQLPATFTTVDWQRALAHFSFRCAYCGRPIGFWHTLAQDHFYPESKGNGYTPDNIVPACQGLSGCNNSKGNRDPVEWLTERFGKRKAKTILKRIQDYFDSLDKT